jgi:hypothetical protein
MGLEQRRFPWRAAIQSALSIADEFCLVYDERFDDPMVLMVDKRVRLIPVTIDFLEWDFVNNLLTKARTACQGEWCLQTEMDIIFDDKAQYTMPLAVQRTNEKGVDAVHVCTVSPVQDIIEPKAGSRQMLTRNMPYIYHKTSPYMIGRVDSDIWDGKCIASYSFDDWSLYDERTKEWFNDKRAEYVDIGFEQFVPTSSQEIEDKVALYTHAWHYPFYNPGRKYAQGRQTAEWQDRTYGRSTELDPFKLIANLNQPLKIDPEESHRVYEQFKASGWIQVNVEHPSWAKEWLAGMGLDAT